MKIGTWLIVLKLQTWKRFHDQRKITILQSSGLKSSPKYLSVIVRLQHRVNKVNIRSLTCTLLFTAKYYKHLIGSTFFQYFTPAVDIVFAIGNNFIEFFHILAYHLKRNWICRIIERMRATSGEGAAAPGLSSDFFIKNSTLNNWSESLHDENHLVLVGIGIENYTFGL